MESISDLGAAELGRQSGLGGRLLEGLARRLLLGKLAALGEGELRLIEAGDGGVHELGRAAADGLRVTVTVRDPAFYPRAVLGGSVGTAESYLDGAWQADDLTAVVRLLVRNRAALERLEGGSARLLAPARWLVHALRANTRRGSRRNIGAHYDLGNDFFRLFLDRTMMYSCALFERPGMTLAEAQEAKLERICRRLALQPSDHLLEIGTGWGGLAEHAAARYGCRVTTTTISAEQHAHARARIRAAGLDERVTVLDRDYRDIEGRFDKLVSVEMIEAVGPRFLDTFFQRAAARLRGGGLMLLQAITIDDRHYRRALRSVDFIQRYIFPGSFIPSVSALTAASAGSGLRLVHLDDLGAHYAETLRRWRRRFDANLEAVRALGFSERFVRLWTYYFCYCEGSFEERAISDVQMLFARAAR